MNVLTLGTFDPPHIGHVVFLQHAATFGDLTVGVNTDRFVEQYRGEPPMYGQAERCRLLHLAGYRVALNDSPGRALIEHLNPDVLVVGSDWARRDYLGQIGVTQDDLDLWGVSVVYVPYTAGISASDIKRRCRA